MAVPRCEYCLRDEQGYYCSAHIYENRVLDCPYDDEEAALEECSNCEIEEDYYEDN